MITVTATEWGVSTQTGTCIDGAILNVHKIVNEPNEWGGIGVVVKHPEFDGLNFPTSDLAFEHALSVGLLKEFVSTFSNKSLDI